MTICYRHETLFESFTDDSREVSITDIVDSSILNSSGDWYDFFDSLPFFWSHGLFIFNLSVIYLILSCFLPPISGLTLLMNEQKLNCKYPVFNSLLKV